VEDAARNAHDHQTSMDLIVGGDVFVPISLGNHYYSSAILRQVMIEFIAKSRVSVIFLCDRLRFLSYRIRGETDLERINSSIRIQLDQMTRALVNLGLDTYPNALVANWSLFQDDPRYSNLLSSLQQFVQSDIEVSRRLEEYTTQLLQHFREVARTNIDDRIQYQQQYILEETALSLYMTEIRSYNIEVYRRGMGFVDYLYKERSGDLMSLMGSSILNRKFISIEHWLEMK
jgi:tRNA-dependent cyclodipeptide synthase